MAILGTEIFRLYDAAKEKFPDFDSWVSEAVRDEFGEDKRDALMAAKICKTTRLPWENPDVFEKIALVMNGRTILPDVIQDASMKEITFAVQVLKKEFPEDDYNDTMCTYFVAEAEEEGMCVFPPCLSFAQPLMSPRFLTEKQQSIQNEYLEECKVYSEFLWKATEGKLPFTDENKEVK